jgi:hypothetical protein
LRDLANAGGYQYGSRSGALMWLAPALWPPWAWMCNCVSSANWRRVDKMDLAKIEKKLREAGFFLNQIRDRESNATATRSRSTST